MTSFRVDRSRYFSFFRCCLIFLVAGTVARATRGIITQKWEAKTGKVYMSLMVDERIEANKEIDAMRAAIRDEAFAGH